MDPKLPERDMPSPMTICLQGSLTEEALAGLQQQVAAAANQQCPVAIDLSEVTLVDRKAVQYFSQHIGPAFRLVNCPVYLLQWICSGAGTETHDA